MESKSGCCTVEDGRNEQVNERAIAAQNRLKSGKKWPPSEPTLCLRVISHGSDCHRRTHSLTHSHFHSFIHPSTHVSSMPVISAITSWVMKALQGREKVHPSR